MIAGYVRLSRDDQGQNCGSLENQKLIIGQFAKSQNMRIDKWYEDDGISGYRFDRPQFQQMLNDLSSANPGQRTIIVKDMSRLGRHNARVLLLLEEFQERGCRLIAVDDSYDSLKPDDDIIGIKTWYNERYIRDTSKKIRRVLHARQKDGSLLTQVPFGYRRQEKDPRLIEIIPEEAHTISLIFHWYLQGMGYRKIAAALNSHSLPTPSLSLYGRDWAAHGSSRRKIALEWSDSMVKEILDNDFYAGVYRLHKRARAAIHGTDARVPKEEQFSFPGHHPSIISVDLFEQAQLEKKRRTPKKGRPCTLISSSSANSPFSRLLFCQDCGCRLTPITRKNKHGVRKYYICGTYNRKGKRFCHSAHLVNERTLNQAVGAYLSLCLMRYGHLLSALPVHQEPTPSVPGGASNLPCDSRREQELCQVKRQLRILLSQKVQDLTSRPEEGETICAAYRALEDSLLSRIHDLSASLAPTPPGSSSLPQTVPNTAVSSDNTQRQNDWTVYRILENAIKKETFYADELELLIASITVDASGIPLIRLRGFLPDPPVT